MAAKDIPPFPGATTIAVQSVPPWLLYSVTYGSLCFSIRYHYPNIVNLLLAAFVSLCVYLWYRVWKQVGKHAPLRNRSVAALCFTTALIFAYWNGDSTYWNYMRPYDELSGLASYVNVDPSLAQGQSYMDSGSIYFKDGTFVSKQHAVAVKSGNVFCVAPIVRQPLSPQGSQGGDNFVTPPSGTIDFWAVGVDCCLPSGEEFNCAEVSSMKARSGVRLLRSDERGLFKLAVDQFSAKFNVRVAHPIFVHFVVDPLATVQGFQLAGHHEFVVDCSLFALGVTCLAIVAHWTFAKVGILQ